MKKLYLTALLLAALPVCASAQDADPPRACRYAQGSARTHFPDGTSLQEGWMAAIDLVSNNPGIAQLRPLVDEAAPPELANPDDVVRELARAYPRDLRAAGVGGRVTLLLWITPDGRVSDLRVVRPAEEPVLNAAALLVARSMRFVPARTSACAVSAFALVPLEFGEQREVAAAPN